MFISHLLFLNWFFFLFLRRDFFLDWRLRGYILRRRWRRCGVSGLFLVMSLLWLRFLLILIFYRLSIRPVFLLFFLLLIVLYRLFNLSMLDNLRYHLWLHLRRLLSGWLLLYLRGHLYWGLLVVNIFMLGLILLCSLFLFRGRWCLLLLLRILWWHLWGLWYHFIIFFGWRYLTAPTVGLLGRGCLPSVVLQMLVSLSVEPGITFPARLGVSEGDQETESH